MAFHKFYEDRNPDRAFGSFETFYMGSDDPNNYFSGPGWFWHACFPGCLPDGEPSGPFATEQEAIDDAQGRV